ncbi:uncharacterized protein LOC120339312 isoform X1 [Styela clava]
MNFGLHPNNTQAKIEELLLVNKNGLCADCGMQLSIETAWAVLSYGIFVCDDCKLVHIEQENHCKALDQSTNPESTVTGILSTSMYQRWEEKDFEQMRIHGNEKVNQKLLSNVPAWQYRPTASDGIKHKEYWINYKYGKGSGVGEEIPKTAGKSFIGIQFARPMPKGSFPCCAVLQNDKLYLTSDAKNEEIHIENIETVLFNSKRIGRENGVQLTYRTSSASTGGKQHANGITYTYLQHENMETVLDWINLILYTKFNLLQGKFPNYSIDEVAKMLNCVTVKESYMSAASHGLIYVSLSEARIACFQHHLDEQPLFHLPVSKALKLSGAQYLEALAQFFGMDVSKLYGYEEWNKCIEHALSLDKLAYLADELAKPINSQYLAKPKPVVETAPAFEKKTVPAEKPIALSPVDEKLKMVNNATDINKAIKDERGNEKTEEKSAKSFDCYPPIGPMGEMGKVARGELPPEAIKPGPPKIDQNRVQMYGLPPQMHPTVSTPPLSHSMMGSQSITPMTSMNHHMPQSRATNVDCYPPISGPIRDMSDVFHPLPRMPQDDGYPVIDEFKPVNSGYKTQDRTYKPRMSMFGEPDLGHFGRMTGNNGVQSPTDLQNAQHFGLGRSASWTNSVSGRTMEQQWQMKAAEQYFQQQQQQQQQKSMPYRIGPSPTGQEQVIMENLQREWANAERRLLALIHNGYVPASDMASAGLDANSLDHAQTCISELFDLLWKNRYDLALSFLRGFREVFSRSALTEIRNQFIGVGELDTMKQIFLQQGREKFRRSRNTSSVTWKQPLNNNNDLDRSWNTAPALVQREPSTDFTPWGLPDLPSSTSTNVWGSTPVTPTANLTSLSSDPWNTAGIVTANPQGNIMGGSNGARSFNRAPSRPISQSRSSFSETSPTEGSFESKTSSNSSASPGVITPPASLDVGMPMSTTLTGIETTLKNLFLNSSASGSTLWN